MPHCWAVIPAQCHVCPQCGKEIQVETEQMDVDATKQLEKVGEFKLTTDYTTVKFSKMKPENAQNMSELYQIAKARGYKPGWAYMQGKRLGLLNKK